MLGNVDFVVVLDFLVALQKYRSSVLKCFLCRVSVGLLFELCLRFFMTLFFVSLSSAAFRVLFI